MPVIPFIVAFIGYANEQQHKYLNNYIFIITN